MSERVKSDNLKMVGGRIPIGCIRIQITDYSGSLLNKLMVTGRYEDIDDVIRSVVSKELGIPYKSKYDDVVVEISHIPQTYEELQRRTEIGE